MRNKGTSTPPHTWFISWSKAVVMHAKINIREPKSYFYAEWWRPKHQQASPPDSIRYTGIYSTTRSWEKDPGFSSPIWHKASSSMYSWAFRGKPESIEKNGLKLNKTVLNAIRAYMARLKEEEARKATRLQEG